MTKSKKNKGFTLVEVMVAAVLVVVAILGAAAYRYVTALDAKKADMQISASRVGLLLLEGWKAQGGQAQGDDEPYDPTEEFTSGIADGIVIVVNSSGGPAVPSGMPILADSGGSPIYFEIQDNNMYFYATLCFKDVVDDPRRINAVVGWRPWGQKGSGSDTTQNIKLTAYVLPN